MNCPYSPWCPRHLIGFVRVATDQPRPRLTPEKSTAKINFRPLVECLG